MIINKTINYAVLGNTATIAKIRETRNSKKYPGKLMYICDLFDSAGNILAKDRYVYDDSFIPELNHGEKEFVHNKIPTDKWNTSEIKLWLSDRQKKDEEGNVIKDDPYAFQTTDVKEVLLNKVKVENEIK